MVELSPSAEPGAARADSPPLPGTVRAAAIVFLLYGLYVAVNATVWQTLAGWADAGQYPRALVRLLGMTLIAWGLWKRQRWAWWFGVGMTAFWLIGGLLGVIVLLRIDAPTGIFPLSMVVTVAAANIFLIAGLVLLLLPSTRAVFLGRDATSPSTDRPASRA